MRIRHFALVSSASILATIAAPAAAQVGQNGTNTMGQTSPGTGTMDPTGNTTGTGGTTGTMTTDQTGTSSSSSTIDQSTTTMPSTGYPSTQTSDPSTQTGGYADTQGNATSAMATRGYDADERPFSGLYIGGTFGYDVQGNDIGSALSFDRNGDNRFGDAILTSTGADAFSTGYCNGAAVGASYADGGCRNDRDDISYYGRVGFDIQRRWLVIGALAEFGKTEITDSTSAFSITPASYTFTRSVDWELGLRGRLGFAARRTLFYGTGGAGYVRIHNRFSTTNTANAFSTNGDRNIWGFQAGGGIEHKIARNLTIGLEYLYHDYKDDEFRVRATQGTAPATNPFVLNANGGTTFRRADEDFRWHSLRVTVGFRF